MCLKERMDGARREARATAGERDGFRDTISRQSETIDRQSEAIERQSDEIRRLNGNSGGSRRNWPPGSRGDGYLGDEMEVSEMRRILEEIARESANPTARVSAIRALRQA